MRIIRTKDYYGNTVEVPVNDEVYAVWQESHRETDRIHKAEIRHRDFTELDDIAEKYPVSGQQDLSELLIQQEEILLLYEAIATLTPLQQQRVCMFMDNLSCKEIADLEGRDNSAVYRSLNAAFTNLRRFLGDKK